MCCPYARYGLIAAVVSLSAWAAYSTAEAVQNNEHEKPETWHPGLPRQHKSKYLVHDLNRPKPAKVEPGAGPGAAPSDAIVLFDGKDLSKWQKQGGGDAGWIVRDGYAEVNSTGSIETKESFGDCQLHLEWANPKDVRGVSQLRGNSGIFFAGKYELQICDNYDNPTYTDGYVGSVYGQHPPLVNPGRASGEWQTYDIIYRKPRVEDGKLVEPGYITAFLNGVLVQHNAEIFGETRWRARAEYGNPPVAEGPIAIQDHGDKQPMRFRNIWVRKIDLSPSE